MAIISLNPRRRVYWSAQRTTPLNQRVNHELCISNQSLMGSFAEAKNLSIRFFALSLRLNPTGRIANDWREIRKSTVVSSVEEIGGTASDGSAGTRRHQTRCCEKGKPRSVSAKMPSPSTGYLPISYGSGFLSLAVSLRQLVFFALSDPILCQRSRAPSRHPEKMKSPDQRVGRGQVYVQIATGRNCPQAPTIQAECSAQVNGSLGIAPC
jgi:hypothetical protein